MRSDFSLNSAGIQMILISDQRGVVSCFIHQVIFTSITFLMTGDIESPL